MTTERPPGERDERDQDRRRLERLLPELIKRVLEVGYGKLSEGPENVRQFVSELKLPKEVLALILGQLDETKNGLYRAVAKELRDFLDNTNLAEELNKVLTTLSLEIKTEVRFVPNDTQKMPPRPDVRARVKIKKHGAEPAQGEEASSNPEGETETKGDQEDEQT